VTVTASTTPSYGIFEKKEEGGNMKEQSRIRFASIGFCLSLALAFGYAPAASAQEDIETSQDCNVQILQGGYGYSFSGFSGPFTTTTPFFLGNANNPGEGRVGAVGLATFDGAGGLIAQDTLARSNVPAIITSNTTRHAGTGTYSVSADCTGHASMDLSLDPLRPDPNSSIAADSEHLEFDLMIVPGTHGREFSFIVTHQAITNQALCMGAVPDCTPKPTLPEQTGVALGTGDEACSNASLQGTYRLLSTGTNLTRVKANANVGFRTFDGAGLVTAGADTGLANGLINVPVGRTGSYSVQSDCTGTDVRNDRATFDLVVVDGGRQAYFLRTQNLAITNVFFKKGPGTFVVHSHDTTLPSNPSADDDSGND
jgi:hypothetical protein